MLLIEQVARISNYFSKVDPLPWTSYLDECLGMLAKNEEIPGDPLLGQCARLQVINNKVAQIAGLENVCEAQGATTASAAKTPWPFYLRAFQAELRTFRETIPRYLQGSSGSTFQSCFASLLTYIRAATSIHLQFRGQGTRNSILKMHKRSQRCRISANRVALQRT